MQNLSYNSEKKIIIRIIRKRNIPGFSEFLKCFLDFWCASKEVFTALIEILQSLQNPDWGSSASFSSQAVKITKLIKNDAVKFTFKQENNSMNKFNTLRIYESRYKI